MSDDELVIQKNRAVGWSTVKPEELAKHFGEKMGMAADAVNAFNNTMVDSIAKAFLIPAAKLAVGIGVSGMMMPSIMSPRMQEDPDGRMFRGLVREAAKSGGWTNKGGNARQRRKQTRKRKFARI